jgi:ribosomal protein S7
MSKLIAGSLSNPKIEKIINYIMKSGKKSVAKRIYHDMLKEIKSN